MVLVKKEIESALQWDAFVLSHAPGALFQSWSWGEVTKKLGQKLWRFGWYEKDVLVAVGQVVKVSARRGTFLHLRHGPVISNPIYWDEVLKDLDMLARHENAWFIRVSPQLSDAPENTVLFKDMGFVPAPIHAMDAELCWVLDLEKSEEELLADMRKTTRYEIRRAQKMGVMIRKSIDTHDIKDFNGLYAQTSARQKFVGHTGVNEEFEIFAKKREAELFLGSFEKTTYAAAIILFWGPQAIYHHGASIPSKIPASYLIQWEAILEAKKRGKKVYNFWGIAPEENPNHPWRGITVFKTGFGGRQARYLHAQDYPVSPLYIIPQTIEVVRRRLKGY